MFKKTLSWLLVVASMAGPWGCATTSSEKKSVSFSELNFEPKTHYQIEGSRAQVPFQIEAKGSRILKEEKSLTILNSDDASVPGVQISQEEINQIIGEKRTGSYIGRGALIGALTGGVAMGTIAIVGGFKSAGDPSTCGDFCGWGDSLVAPVIAGSILSGAIIGAGIGYAIPKKSEVIISPTLSLDSDGAGSQFGFLLSKEF